MARYIDAIDLPVPIEEAFDYLADFSRTAEWDPGVAEARRLTRGAVRRGTWFRLTLPVLGRRIRLEYQITEFEPPSRLVLTGGDEGLRCVDEITFAPLPGGTRVTYEARVEPTGLLRIADPLLNLWLRRTGRAAIRGLREHLTDRTVDQTIDQRRGAA